MKKALIGIISFIAGGLSTFTFTFDIVSKEKDKVQATLEDSRYRMVGFNKEYNKVYNNLVYMSLYGSKEEAELSTIVLTIYQNMMPKLLEVNKSLKLDCKQYKNGSPSMIEDEFGHKKPVEALPEEILIEEDN